MLKIHDIKPIVEIPDYTVYLYYGLILIAFLLICLIGYFIYKYFTKPTDITRETYLKKLKSIDYKDTKQTAYNISLYGRYLATTERQIRLFEELHHLLEEYKYKKTISDNIPNELKTKLDIFLESLDV